MKKNNKKSLKGFTLIELVVVVAVFGLLIAATLSFVQPARKVYKNAAEYSGASGMIDNVRRVVEDNLRFANRMNVIVGPDISGGEEAFIQTEVQNLRHKFHFDDTNRKTYFQDTVYVMKIDNPEASDFSGYAAGADKPGKVSIWQYDSGALNSADSKEWALAEGVYNEYSFSLSKGTTFTSHPIAIAGVRWDIIDTCTYDSFGGSTGFMDPADFSLVLDIYKNAYDDRSNPAASSFKLTDVGVSETVALAFVNMADGHTLKDEEIKLTDLSDPNGETTENCGHKYNFEDRGNSMDLYFFYTIPDID
jgi:prepilin-type N-terminal cleavage/methylation domain-containing protein